jgi:PhzF family phenazine biosynthesis protein
MQRRFQQVDVFTATPYLGNPLAVVLDGSGISDGDMQRFARWTNLSETTFVLPPTAAGADYRVRIFTRSGELPFAGHPTLGTCHAWLEAGGQPRTPGTVIQQCGAGLITIRQGADGLAFAAPPLLRSGPVDEPLANHVAEILRIRRDEIVDIQWADNGPGWIAVLLDSADAVLAVRPGPTDLDIGVVGPYPPKVGATDEDPVTGSLNASVAQWLIATDRAAAPYLVRQGTILDRNGQVRITVSADGTVWVGGDAVTCIAGTVEL